MHGMWQQGVLQVVACKGTAVCTSMICAGWMRLVGDMYDADVFDDAQDRWASLLPVVCYKKTAQ